MLISQMLQVNVEARFTADEVLSHPWVTVSDWRIGSSKSLINFYTDDGDEFLQDEAPPVDSITVSNAEEQDIEEDLDPDEDSPTLETRQVPSPVVWSLLSHQQLEAEDTTASEICSDFFSCSVLFFFFLFIQENLFSLIQNTGFSHCRSNRFVWLVYRNTPHSVETEKKHIQVNVHQSLQWLKLKTTRSLRGNSLTNWTLNSHSEQSRTHRPVMVLTSRSKMDLGSKTYYTLNTVKTVQSSAFLKR